MRDFVRTYLLIIGVYLGLFSLAGFAQNAPNNAELINNTDAESLHLIASKLQKINMMSSSFLQSKKIKILSRPLVSSGSFTYVHSKGLSWRVEKPIVTTMLFTQDGMYEYSENKADQVTADILSKGALTTGPMTAFTNMFGALFTGNTTELEQLFSIEVQAESKIWTMKLTPKNQNLAKFVKTIQLSGNDHVEGIAIYEINGDETHLTFSNVQLNRPLSTEEEKYFKG